MASHIIGDMSGSTLDDPLSERYEKLGCSVSPLDKNSEEYQMITKYLEKTYEPVVVGAIVSYLNIVGFSCLQIFFHGIHYSKRLLFRELLCILGI